MTTTGVASLIKRRMWSPGLTWSNGRFKAGANYESADGRREQDQQQIWTPDVLPQTRDVEIPSSNGLHRMKDYAMPNDDKTNEKDVIPKESDRHKQAAMPKSNEQSRNEPRLATMDTNTGFRRMKIYAMLETDEKDGASRMTDAEFEYPNGRSAMTTEAEFFCPNDTDESTMTTYAECRFRNGASMMTTQTNSPTLFETTKTYDGVRPSARWKLTCSTGRAALCAPRLPVRG